MTTANLFDLDAELGSEEDEEFEGDEEESRPRKQKANIDDSSEEEEDDDEEAEREIREGFIVDEDEEDDEERRERRREKRKRRREEREAEDALLDEEDLDLIGETHPDYQRRQEEQSKFKRLKRGHREDRDRNEARGIDDIFSDDEEMADTDGRTYGREPRAYADEFADFIEEDEFPDEEREAMRDAAEVRRPGRGYVDPLRMQSGLDESAQEDMMAAFGDGTEYDWALQLQEEGDENQEGLDKPLELKDVFEPSQLADRMLTEADNIIRNTDVPERYQIARQPFREMELSDEEMNARMQEETHWISNFLLPKKRLDRDLVEPFREVVGHVLRFMNVEELEIPFILHNRKDYLIHEERVPLSPNPNDPDAPQHEIKASRLLQNSDLWEIYELDLKYRAFVEKREALSRSIESIRDAMTDSNDEIFNDMIPAAVTMEELQDVQDYLHFQYAAQLKDTTVYDAETNGTQKRARGTRNVWDKVRAGQAYHMVRAFGISADALAQNALKVGTRQYTEDPTERPDDMADKLVDGAEYSSSQQLLAAAKAMFAEELAQSPRMRKLLRQNFYMDGVFDCFRTEKGLKRIDEEHPYYEFKYLRGKDLRSIVAKPELFLRMLKAEDEGLVEVRVRMEVWDRFKDSLYKNIMSDNFSELADAWNALRREVLDMALEKLTRTIVKGVKENLKTECEAQIARACREEYANKLDQAPYKPRGMVLGTTPRVLALSNGAGKRNDAICWAYVDENGRVLENGKFVDIRMGNKEKFLPDGADVGAFVDLVERRKPDVVAVSGFSVETRRLYKDLQEIIESHDLRGTPYEEEDGSEQSDKLDIVITNDEVARLYYTSDRATAEHPTVPPLTRYCIALARYMQSPLKEYAALGRDITSISFTSNQTLIPQEKVLKHLEMAMIETVNLVGVDVNEAVSDSYTANLLQYVSGLGPRKAAHLLKVVNSNGGDLNTRYELIGVSDRSRRAAVGPKIFENCASFLYINYDDSEPDSDYLDNTRVHPEDYETARKIVADTLDMDEEDVKAEIDEAGPNAVVRKLIKDDAQDKLNDLVLDDYAEEILRKIGLKKKATLELIRGELQQPYEELRRSFYLLSTDEVFTMLTGETKESLTAGMIVPVSIKRTFPDHIDVKLDCGIDGTVNEQDFPAGVGNGGAEPRHVWQTHQTIQAKLLEIEPKRFTARLSLREDDLREPFRREFDHEPGQWDEQQEAQDKKEALLEKDAKTGRAQRVIKHPLFRPFNSAQAEEYLGSQAQGDVVIRPSSKGLDHLAVTWKVSENVFQHIDVLELDKENEFSVGRTLKVGGKYTYSDLDELIVLHVKAMAKKVDEIMTDERFQKGSREATNEWLNAYTEANPIRSMYAFCINPKYPGYFDLCFKAGASAKVAAWPVKVIPNAFELQRHPYPDMRALKNGFKLLFSKASGVAKR
ncbi:transcription elongation factor spt6, partial [Aureobasidium melanogenum]